MNTNEYGDIKSNENHVSIIYGALPPESKLMQQQNFNERKGKTKFMVATDAIGMGMNLNIKRIIFSTLSRPFQRSKNQ
jgi:ATP-dependent RNA helicase SUPV3L1/SUV3